MHGFGAFLIHVLLWRFQSQMLKGTFECVSIASTERPILRVLVVSFWMSDPLQNRREEGPYDPNRDFP